jgi:hypothetical protein
VADLAKAITLDAKGVWGQFAAGGADAGLSVVYTDKTAALKRVVAAANSTPVVLVPSGLHDVQALSPDGTWVLASNVVNPGSSPPISDLYLASATTAGTATPLVATAIASPVGTDWFTADSSHALYGSATSSAAGVASTALYTVATSGGTPTQLSSNVGVAFATSGGKIVFDANDDLGGYDLLSQDTSQSGAPTLLVSVADEAFFLTAAKDMIVYTWSFTSDGTAGLYAMPVP